MSHPSYAYQFQENRLLEIGIMTCQHGLNGHLRLSKVSSVHRHVSHASKDEL